MPGFWADSLPNSSASSNGSLIALQLIRTNDAPRRGDISWMRSANRSLPTPVSPTTTTLSRPTEIRDADCSSEDRRLDSVAVSRREPARVCTISVTAPTKNGTPTVSRIGRCAGSFTPSTNVPFELPTSSIWMSVPIVRLAWWRDTDPESITTSHLLARPIVSVPPPGSGITWRAAPSITSSTRSPNGASRSICSVVAPGSSSITRVAYANGRRHGNSSGSLAVEGGRFEPAPRDPEGHPAGDGPQDLVGGTGLTRDVDQPQVRADRLELSVAVERGR